MYVGSGACDGGGLVSLAARNSSQLLTSTTMRATADTRNKAFTPLVAFTSCVWKNAARRHPTAPPTCGTTATKLPQAHVETGREDHRACMR